MAARRIMAVDYGTRRIGTAIADLETRIATPLTTLEGRNDPAADARSVGALGAREGVERFVVGLPLNMDGSAGAQAGVSRRFAEELARQSGLAVELEDERLSTFAAAEAVREAGLSPRGRKTRKRGVADRVAAMKILEAYLARTG